LHHHKVLIDLRSDGAKERGEFVLIRSHLRCEIFYISSMVQEHNLDTSLCLVFRGMPILKHCSWISCMHARAGEAEEKGAM
jgi:hypothetical protein